MIKVIQLIAIYDNRRRLLIIVKQSKQIRINLNIINKINFPRMANRSTNKEFSIIKFQPGNILLMHKSTKTPYQYFQIQPDINPQFDISHPALIRPIVYNNGVLYLKGMSTLKTELQNRKKAYNVVHYEEEQIYNTFAPILECINFLHGKGIVHGSISPCNILITDDEKIKIKDWLVDSKQHVYYFNKNKKDITRDDDFIAIGQIMAEVAILHKGTTAYSQKETFQALEGVVDRYSKGLILAIAVLLKKNKQKFHNIVHYLNNDQKYLNDIELNTLYDTIKKEKEKKKMSKLANQNNVLNPNNLKLTITSLHQSPLKKNTPNNSLGNTIKRLKQDNQNKKTGNDETKKKQIQKINKIIERSNEFVNELMARKNNEHILKKIAPKPNVANISLCGELNKKIIKESPLITSPSKKIRTTSRKK